MLQISTQDVLKRLTFDNPWWEEGGDVDKRYQDFPARDYLEPFIRLVENRSVNRAIILLGPRRVGKTVIIHQTIKRLLQKGSQGRQILFLSLETPVYTDTALETFVLRFMELYGHKRDAPLTVFFDEIQYLKDWEVHLKSLVDTFPVFRFVVSGSAAAALRLKSRESGAGRFTEFLLPPLTFAEYLDFTGQSEALIVESDTGSIVAKDIVALNESFLEYLNIGGYPEAVFNPTIRGDSERFIKSDIIDKVLLRDLPQLYGIRDIQELNRLFTTLAYNTGNEVTLEELSKSSGVSKTTLIRYLEYLEAAFLVRRVRRIDQNARHFQRATSFKIYLNNPSMRAALFGPPAEDDESMGALAETAIFAQWFHFPQVIDHLYYARWKEGEIDIVYLDPTNQRPAWAHEIKWSDRPAKDSKLLRHLATFKSKHPSLQDCVLTTRTITEERQLADDFKLSLIPTSLVAYKVGKFSTEMRAMFPDAPYLPNTAI